MNITHIILDTNTLEATKDIYPILVETERQYIIDHPLFGVKGINKQLDDYRFVNLLDKAEVREEYISYWSLKPVDEALEDVYSQHSISSKEDINNEH